MPVGITVNTLSVLFGGLLGGIIGKWVPDKLKASLPTIFGFAAISMGIIKVMDTTNLTIVILALIVGAVIGELLSIDACLEKIAVYIITKIQKTDEPNVNTDILVMAILAFCISGTAIFGALNEGFVGDSSILLSKSVLDFSTALIFSSIIGISVAFISIPQFVFLMLVYLSAEFIAPIMTPDVLGNFLAIGGIITIMIGAHMAKISNVKAANVIPAILVVLVLSLI